MKTLFDDHISLFNEVYGPLPFPVIWCTPMVNEVGQVIDFAFRYCNPEGYAYLRHTPATLVGLTIKNTDTLSGELRDSVMQEMLTILETGQPSITTVHNSMLGTHVRVQRTLMRGGILSILQDLPQEQLVLHQVVAHAQAAMFSFMPVYERDDIVDFRFGMANPAFSAYVGQQPSTLIGALGSTWFPGYMTNGVFDMYKHTFLNNEPQRKEVHYNVDGIDIYIDLQSVRVGDQVLVSFTDHTELRRSQQELQRTVKALEHSNRDLQDFAHAASHDMKEPLRKVQYGLDRVARSLEEKKMTTELQLLDRAMEATGRLRRLLDDLLEFAHVNTGGHAPAAVDLNGVLHQVISNLDLVIEEKKARVAGSPLPVVMGFGRPLEQLFQNLVSNALKYTSEERLPIITVNSITVSPGDALWPADAPEQLNAGVVITIADNGIGFDQTYAERIFGMFERLHSKSVYPGTGIGLALCRKVVDNHHGLIWAAGQEGRGATFFIFLPQSGLAPVS